MDTEEKGRRRLRRSLAALGGAALLLAAVLLVYRHWERPPEQRREVPEISWPPQAETEGGRQSAFAPGTLNARQRRPGVYTLLLAGSDDGNGNTDTILVARLDTQAHRLDCVSIPRDTLVNLDWSVRKINAVYAGTANSGGRAAEGLKAEICKLCGFTPDCYAVADLEDFIQAVDLAGGVDFEVPSDMDYDDAAQGLHIHLSAGPQRLDGRQALGLVRYRSGYWNGDLGRVEMQQRFLRAAAGQFLRLGSLPRLKELAALLAEDMDTDLTAANIAWLVRQLLLCREEDLSFQTMPTVPVTVRGLSYTAVEPEPWLELLNRCLNPYAEALEQGDLDLVYYDGSTYRSTSGVLRGPEYYE